MDGIGQARCDIYAAQSRLGSNDLENHVLIGAASRKATDDNPSLISAGRPHEQVCDAAKGFPNGGVYALRFKLVNQFAEFIKDMLARIDVTSHVSMRLAFSHGRLEMLYGGGNDWIVRHG